MTGLWSVPCAAIILSLMLERHQEGPTDSVASRKGRVQLGPVEWTVEDAIAESGLLAFLTLHPTVEMGQPAAAERRRMGENSEQTSCENRQTRHRGSEKSER